MNDSRASRLALMDALPPELLERVLRLPFEELLLRKGATEEDRNKCYGQTRDQKDAALKSIESDLPGRLREFFGAARVCKQWKAVWSIINDDDDFWLTNCKLRWPSMHTHVFSLWHHARVSGVAAAGVPAGGNAEAWRKAFEFGTVRLSGSDLSRVMLWIEAYSADDIVLDRELRLSEIDDGWAAPELADDRAPNGGYSWQEVKDWEIEWGLEHGGGRVTLSASPRVTQTFDCRDGTGDPSTDDLEDTSTQVNAEGRWGYADIICGPDDMPFRTCQLSRSVHAFALKTVLALDYKRYKRRRKSALQAGNKEKYAWMDKFATAEEYLAKREPPELEMNAMLNFRLGSEETIIEQSVDMPATPPSYSLEVWADGTGGMGCGDMSTHDLKVWVGLLDFREED